SCTGARRLADAEKNVAEPPSTSSALPKGVSTESSATEPTTSTEDIEGLGDGSQGEGGRLPAPRSHSLRRGDAQDREAVGEDHAGGAREHQSGVHYRRRLVQN